MLPCREMTEHREQLIERRAAARGHVVDLIHGVGPFGKCSTQVGLHHIADEAEVAAGFAITVDIDGPSGEERRRPTGDDGRIGTVGILPRSEHVEIPQADGGQAVASGEDVGVQLVHVLRHRIRRQRRADHVLDLGQRQAVAIGGTRCRVHEAPRPGVAGCNQHVQETVDVRRIARNRVLDGTRYRPQRGVVQDPVDTLACGTTGRQIADVALDEPVAAPAFRADDRGHLLQVAPVAGGEIVEADHLLVQKQQMLDQVGTDETCAARDKPTPPLCAHLGRQRLTNDGVGRHHGSETPDPHSGRTERSGVGHALHVRHQASRQQLRQEIIDWPLLELLVRDRGDQCAAFRQLLPGTQIHAVLVLRFVSLRDGIVNVDPHPVGFELVDDVHHARVA